MAFAGSLPQPQNIVLSSRLVADQFCKEPENHEPDAERRKKRTYNGPAATDVGSQGVGIGTAYFDTELVLQQYRVLISSVTATDVVPLTKHWSLVKAELSAASSRRFGLLQAAGERKLTGLEERELKALTTQIEALVRPRDLAIQAHIQANSPHKG